MQSKDRIACATEIGGHNGYLQFLYNIVFWGGFVGFFSWLVFVWMGFFSFYIPLLILPSIQFTFLSATEH